MSNISTVMAGLTGQPIQNGINAADFLKGAAPATGIGTLTTTQVQGLMAQTAASAKQAADAVTASGIGKYAMPPQQLEQLGFLKPGTVATYLKDGSNVQSVLSSPAVWTGKDGVGSLNSFLSNPDKQAQALQAGLTNSFANLSKAGVLNNITNPADVASLMQVATKFGVQNASLFAKGAAPSALVNEMNNLAKSAQFSINFTDTKLPAGLKGQIQGQNVERQFDRAQVDNAAKSILGNDKIPTPDYKTNSRDKIKAQQQAIDDVERAKANYEKVLAANGGNRSAPAVEAAYAEFKAANERLQKA